MERGYSGLPIIKRVVFSNPPRVEVDVGNRFLGELERDAHTLLLMSGGRVVALVQKNRPYVSGPADLMLLPAHRSVSQLCDLDEDEGRAILEISGSVVSSMLEVSKGSGRSYPVIALNQQPSCVRLPEKYEAGLEVKVQTIDQLHLHLFLEDGEGDPFLTIATLAGEDKKDFIDTPGLALGEVLLADLSRRVAALNNSATTCFCLDRYPLGINIKWGERITNITGDPAVFGFIRYSQERLVAAYQEFCECLTVDGADWWQNGSKLRPRRERIARTADYLEANCRGISDFSKRVAMLLASNIVPRDAEDRQHLKMIYGPSCTWIIYENSSGAFIHLSPKVLSRGNAMECLGIWKDQFEEADAARQQLLDRFYLDLQDNLSTKGHDIQKGPLLTERGL